MRVKISLVLFSIYPLFTACQSPFSSKSELPAAVLPTSNFLYIASGGCYAGGVATSAPTNQIIKVDADTGLIRKVVVDYRTQSPGDSPVSIASIDSKDLVVSVENTSGRRLDQIHRDGSGGALYLLNAAFSQTFRGMSSEADGSFLISRLGAVEKFTPFRTRVPAPLVPFISNPLAAACTGMATNVTFSLEMQNGKVIVGHEGATPNNKIANFVNTGYTIAADCISSKVAPSTTAMPTAGVSVSNDTILVAYAGALPADNKIVSYKIDTTTNNLATATTTTVLNDVSKVLGASAMAFDSQSQMLYVASAASSSERIEKFLWDNTGGTLTRVGTVPFIHASDLGCVSSLMIGP